MKLAVENMEEKLKFKAVRFASDEYNKFGDLVNVGSIIKTKGGKLHLVGDVNELLGICDDCRDFQMEDIIAISHINQLIESK